MGPVELERAELIRSRLFPEMRASKRARLRVRFELTARCSPRVVEGIVQEVSATGAIIKVRDSNLKAVIEVTNEDIVNVEFR